MKQLLFISTMLMLSCSNAPTNAPTNNTDSISNISSPSNTGVISINNLDSLNYIYTSQSHEINSALLNHEVTLTGTIKNGSFAFYSDAKDNRKTGSPYGVETDLKTSDISNIIGTQPAIFFYDKSKKEILNNGTIPNDYSASELLNNIYNVFAPSSENRDIDKGMGNDEPDMNEARRNYAKLKEKYPDVAKSLMSGEIAAVNFHSSGQPIADFIVIDEVTVQGKLIDLQLNQLNKMWFKLAGAKIVSTKRTLNLDNVPAFVPSTIE